MAKILYEIPNDLHYQAKVAAALEGITLKQFIIDAIGAAVGDEPTKKAKK